jgi:MATE family multidrug resistance protein
MYPTRNWKEKIALFLSILWPILITQVGYNAMTVIDTMMSGRAGTEQLAGVAIGFNIWMPVSIGLGGILLAITPIVGQLLGKGEQQSISQAVTQGLYLSILIAVVLMGAGVFLLDPVLQLMSIEDPEVYRVAKHYLIAIGFGIIPYFASQVIRYFFDAQGYTRITMFIVLIGLPINGLLNYLLIFGKLGFPALGGVGAGYATAVTYWIILGISIWLAVRLQDFRPYKLFKQWYAPSWRAWLTQMKIGVPIGLSIFFEASIFSLVSLMIAGMFDTVTLAAHQVAMSFSSLMFMIPLSISMSLTIMVAYEVGGERYRDAKQYTMLGVISALGIMAMGALLLLFFREQVAALYNDQREVIELAKQFFLFAIIYQLSDASQASLQGVLRGYKDVTLPFVTALISYWGIGLPTGYLLSAFTELGAYGFWVGITVGLTCAAVGFLFRLLTVQRKARAGKLAGSEA